VVLFDPEQPGPFGEPLKALPIRHHLLPKDLPLDAEPTAVTHQEELHHFSLGRSALSLQPPGAGTSQGPITRCRRFAVTLRYNLLDEPLIRTRLVADGQPRSFSLPGLFVALGRTR
jgi:hypothetical protein